MTLHGRSASTARSCGARGFFSEAVIALLVRHFRAPNDARSSYSSEGILFRMWTVEFCFPGKLFALTIRSSIFKGTCSRIAFNMWNLVTVGTCLPIHEIKPRKGGIGVIIAIMFFTGNGRWRRWYKLRFRSLVKFLIWLSSHHIHLLLSTLFAQHEVNRSQRSLDARTLWRSLSSDQLIC